MTEPITSEIHTLDEAPDDEYRAWATYDQVIADFGPLPPFTNIRDAEARHVDALHTLYTRYGLPIPPNPWPGNMPRYASLQEACAAGMAAEIANGELYDRLLAATERADILTMFRNLQEASQQRHLTAFQRCAQGLAGGGRRRGRQHRGGKRQT